MEKSLFFVVLGGKLGHIQVVPWQIKSTLVTIELLPKCRGLQRFSAFCHAYLPPLFSRKSARNAKRGKSRQVNALNRSLPVVGYGVFEYRDL